MQFLERGEALLGSIKDSLFSTTHATRAFVLLGPSVTKPREAYQLVFPPCSEGATLANEVDRVCRLTRRELVLHAHEQPEGSAAGRRCKVFVLFKAEGDQHCVGSPSPDYTAQRGWRLRMTRGTQVEIKFGTRGGAQAKPQPGDGEHGSMAAKGATPLYFCSVHVPQGLLARKEGA